MILPFVHPLPDDGLRAVPKEEVQAALEQGLEENLLTNSARAHKVRAGLRRALHSRTSEKPYSRRLGEYAVGEGQGE